MTNQYKKLPVTLAADKITNSLQTVPPDAPHLHQPATCLHAMMVELTATSLSRSGLRFASHLLFRKPALKTKFSEQAFSHAGPAVWNSLADYIKVKFEIHIADRKAITCIYAKLFLLHCVNPAAPAVVRCYSFWPPGVASQVNYSSQRTESSSEHFAVISAC